MLHGVLNAPCKPNDVMAVTQLKDAAERASERIKKLDAENERLANALEYIYESGILLNQDVLDKARWGLGLEVENPEEIASLKPRFS